MSNAADTDYYELLQVSPNAQPETIHRVYRMLAQRLHPDNQMTGDSEQFRHLTEAYRVLCHAERRTQYDIARQSHQQDRARLLSESLRALDDMGSEQLLRVAVLEVLYGKRRMEPARPGVFFLDLEKMTGRPREHLECTLWYLVQRGYVVRSDGSTLEITADGVDYLESRCAVEKPVPRLGTARPVARAG